MRVCGTAGNARVDDCSQGSSPPDSYGLVLVLVVLTYVVSVSFVAGWAQSLVIAIQLVTVWLTFRTANAALSARVLTLVVFVAVAAVVLVNLFITLTTKGLAVAFVISALLYLVAPFAVVRDIATRRNVDQETVLGAIAAYLIVGMCFAFTYRAIGAVQPTPFFGTAGPGEMSDALFFSFVTLTTTGYGNLVPATNPGQSLAVMEAVLGQSVPGDRRRQDHHGLEAQAVAELRGTRLTAL